jgi:dipeptidyl aminopeptidase/acylaminoacyl peptidase
MISRLKSLTLDQAALGLVLVLVVAIGLVLLAGAQAGILVSADVAEAGQGPFEAITLTFSVPVDGSAVESRFSLDPQAGGRFEWLDPQTLVFVPDGLQPGARYQLALRPGEIGANQESLRREKNWSFQTRSPLIVYTSAPIGENELWVIGPDGGEAQRLVDSEQTVFNYDVSPDGEFLILSMFNEQDRSDLWRVDRDGQNLRLLLDCGGGNCSNPAVSPDGKRVAYTREAPGITPNSSLSAPRIHILDLVSGQDRPLFSDSQIIGYGPTWSPDGKWVTSYDGIQDTIRVVSVETGEQVLLSSVVGGSPSWSPDSTQLAFTTIEEGENELVTVVMLADFRTGEISYLIGKGSRLDYKYYAIAWSPVNEDELILGLRPNPEDPSTGLWLVDPGLLEGQMFAQEASYSYYAPRWDPWGKAVVFQQIRLGAAYRTEIALWEPGLSAPRVIAEGFSPRWLP